jgi:Zn-finger nucleic acid-binding protein
MKCPVCDVPLSISSREGVEIDFCPQCRGVWLDRGELDKVIDRAAAAMAPAPSSGGQRDHRDDPGQDDRGRERYDDSRRYDDDRRYEDRRRYDEDDRRPDKKRKKKSFLENLFEFD